MNKVLLFNKYGISSGRLYSFEELYIWIDTWSDLSAPGCLKDSPTPQRPFSSLSAFSHPMMQHKIYPGEVTRKGKLAGGKGKPEEEMF